MGLPCMGSSEAKVAALSAALRAPSGGGVAISPPQSAASASFHLSNLPHCALSSYKTSCFVAVTYQAIAKMALHKNQGISFCEPFRTPSKTTSLDRLARAPTSLFLYTPRDTKLSTLHLLIWPQGSHL
jgi:hypothetical protein